MNSLAERRAVFAQKLCREQFEKLFLFSAAPILRGVRPAVLITLRPECYSAWRARRNALQKSTGLCTKEIINRRGTLQLLIYDENALCEYLSDESIRRFLSLRGYSMNAELETHFQRLQEHFLQESCPHEIGLFLGYPLDDVKSFIKNKGKNCICCRYWKVYHHPEQAQKTFRLIDEAQHYAMDVLCEPKPIHIAVNLLKNAG